VPLVRPYRLTEGVVEFEFRNGLRKVGAYTLRIEVVTDDGPIWSTAPLLLQVVPKTTVIAA
jgi:hypothetical protein